MPDRSKEILDRNLEGLLRRSYRPVTAGDAFQRRLLTKLIDRQSRGLGAGVSVLPLAAAATLLLVILVGLYEGPTGVVATPLSQAGFRLERGSSWRRAGGPVHLRPGDTVATAPAERVRVDFPGGASAEIDPEALLRLGVDSGLRLERGSCRVVGAAETHHTITTPILKIHARGADYRVAIRPTAASQSGERETEMRNKVVVGAGIGATVILAVIVTVYQTDADPVQVEHSAGTTVGLRGGETGVFAADGEITITRAKRPDLATAQTAEAPSPESDGPAIEGIVQNLEGEPLAGAQVRFHPTGDATPAISSTVESDAEGRFDLRLAEPEPGTIEVAKARFRRESVPWSPRGVAPPLTDEPLVIRLTPETAISGRVFEEGGEPLPQFSVSIQRYLDLYRRMEPVIQSFATTDGTYYFGGIKAGNYRVWAYAEGFSCSREIKVEVRANEHRSEVDFTLSPGEELQGRVYDRLSGRPVEGAIAFLPLEHLPGSVNFFERSDIESGVRNARHTGQDGRVHLKDLSPARHLLRILHPDYMPVDLQVDLTSANDTRFFEIALEKGRSIRGEVLDRDGNPRRRAAVLAFSMAVNPEGAQQSLTRVEEDGHYELRNLQPGQYIVVMVEDIEGERSEDSDDEAKVTMTTLPPHQDAVVDFIEIPELATLRGRVVDEDGEPIAKIQVTCSTDDEGGFTFKTGHTNEEGRFEILNLKLGEYTVALSRGYGQNFAAAARVSLTEARDYEEELVFTNLALSGFVKGTNPDGAVQGAEVLFLLRSEDGAELDFAGRSLTDDQGRFRVDGLRPGTYRLWVRAAGYRLTTVAGPTLRSPDEREGEVEVTLLPGSAVSVTVLDTAGHPVPEALVFIANPQGVVINQGLPPRTDDRGTYHFDSLGPGEYQVRVQRTTEEEPVVQPFTTAGEHAEVTVELPDPVDR